MVGTSLVLITVAILFLRNQIRPILRLADAAESFGKGREVPDFRPRGAREVRRAAQAFIEMKRRIERSHRAAHRHAGRRVARSAHHPHALQARARADRRQPRGRGDEEGRRRDGAHAGGLSRLRARRFRRAVGADRHGARSSRSSRPTPSATATRSSVRFHGHPIVTVRPAAFKRCLANLVVECRAPRAVDLDHRPSRPSLADRHGRRRRPGHRRRICARRCSSRSCGSTTRATRTRAAPASGLRSRATSRARTAATSSCRTVRSAACARPCGCRCKAPAAATDHTATVSSSASSAGGAAASAGGTPSWECGKDRRAGPTSADRARARGRAPPWCGRDRDRRRRPRCAAPTRTAARAPARAACPCGPEAPMSAAVSIHCCERTREPLQRQREAGIAHGRAHQRAHRLLVRREQLEPAHQHVEQPFARRLLGHVGIVAGKHGAVDLLHMRGEDRKRRAEFIAQFGERHPGRAWRSRQSRSARSAFPPAAP